jgi:drug/metabolite transporter (DMT)-like permease
MVGSLVAALAAAVAFGIASVLQQVGARRPAARPRIGPGLVADLARQPLFLLGIALDAGGFILTFLALRRLPLFAVESAVASAVAVTAVAARWVGDRLTGAERVAVAAVVVGLALVGASALPEGPPSLSWLPRLLLLAGVPALGLLGVAVSARVGERRAAPVLGALAGTSFAAFGIACRVLPASGAPADPLAWAAVAYAALGLLLYGAALQRGSVTVVAAATSTIEVLVPAVVGLALADGARSGLAPLAVIGFLLTLGATLCLIHSQSATRPRPMPAPVPIPGQPVPSAA